MNRNKDEYTSSTPLFCDFFETLLHNFLHSRHLYPPECFELRQKFGVPVWICTHRDVLTYIESLISGIKNVLEENRIERIDVCVVQAESEITLETFAIEPLSLPRYISEDLTVEELFKLEMMMRRSLLDAIQIFSAMPDKNESDLEKRTWRMKVKTKLSAYKRLLEKQSVSDEVMWLATWSQDGEEEVDDDVVGTDDDDRCLFQIIPMTNLMSQFIQVQLYIKDYKNTCRR
ncbi:hypothetical protein HELRODRAFT_166455 [Helobdella robusta]|uniref:HORMA domain-containing protein n=1 Tax=Helobdella robusta TaxID=6412 RepID=T1EY55_HELRO|nr:hypothetical protein HELRODRAFT_166455 [Helobdella robusta]ESN90752.1 hypothetical protein HELRODRAFT_166455 [Helobdella robusta]